MFSKIDKKVLIWLVAALVVAALIGIAAYKQLLGNAGDVQNSTGGAKIQIKATTKICKTNLVKICRILSLIWAMCRLREARVLALAV